MKIMYSLTSDFDKKNHAECICYEDRIVLHTYNDGGFFRYYDNKEKTIFIRDIASVIVSEGVKSVWSLNGGWPCIQFHVKGSTEKPVDEIMPNDANKAKPNELIDNNAVIFRVKYKQDLLVIANQIKKYVENKLASIEKQKNAPSNSQMTIEDPYHEILKYKNLYDEGIITEEEFIAAKKLILRM